MGKASSAKKVARAARAGQTAGSNAKERRELGFPMAIVAVVVLGAALVTFARLERDVSAAEPTLQDHWHSAYGVYDCRTESFLEPFGTSPSGNGIHSHADGLIHIHPISSNATGGGAVLEEFIDNVGGELEDDSFALPDGSSLPGTGVDCDGEPAVLQVLRWAPGNTTTPSEIITTNLEQTRFEVDGEAFTIALAPLNAEIPAPPSVGTQATDVIEAPGSTDFVPGSIPGATEAPDGSPIAPDGTDAPTTTGAG